MNDDLRGDSTRITRRLDQVAALSDTDPADGVTRLAYTLTERRAHDLFSSWMKDLDLHVYTDAVGNTIAEHPGTLDMPGIGTGSHLDSVPRGGRFDGIAGVVAATEVAELLVKHDIEHQLPWRFVVFAGEEGARFGQACIGSKAAGGMWTAQALEEVRDSDGVSIAAAMQELGFDHSRVDEAAWGRDEWAAFVELHVEQGQVLETARIPIGLVDLISGSTRFTLSLSGTASHTGSTPMELRADALCAASEVVLLAEEIANDSRHRGTRCTVGKLEVRPGSLTTIPGEVTLWVDVRDVDSARQRETADEIVRRARDVCTRRAVSLIPQLLSDASPVVLPGWLRDVMAGVCEKRDVPFRVMYSGASHDSQMVAHTVPVGMLFVPSRGGLSHVPEEWSSTADVALGAELLFQGLLKLDEHFVEVTEKRA